MLCPIRSGARDMNSPALQRALDRIEIEFANPNGRAISMARHALRHGAAEPGARARYEVLATIAADCRYDMDSAVNWLNGYIASERHRVGRYYLPASPLALEIGKEARLIVRWLRRHRPELWLWVLSAIVTPVGHPVMIEAAE